MQVFHGMTRKAYENFIGKAQHLIISPWTCSDGDNWTYLHTISHAESETEPEWAQDYAIQQAKESAIIQAACNSDDMGYVFILDIPEDLLETDTSCENMEFCRRVPCDVFEHYSQYAKIETFSVNPYFHIIRLAAFVKNDQFNWDAFDCEMFEACKVISKCDLSGVYDSLFD